MGLCKQGRILEIMAVVMDRIGTACHVHVTDLVSVWGTISLLSTNLVVPRSVPFPQP